jgi:hypothetical protein
MKRNLEFPWRGWLLSQCILCCCNNISKGVWLIILVTGMLNQHPGRGLSLAVSQYGGEAEREMTTCKRDQTCGVSSLYNNLLS